MNEVKTILKATLPVALGVIVGMIGYEQYKKMTAKTEA